MRLIGFDSATDDVVVAAVDGAQTAFEMTVPAGPDGRPVHSRALLSGISDAAASLGGWDRVERIATGIGPGTFTGLRIAVSTAIGLGISTGTSAVGVSTLEAMARSLGNGGSFVVPVLDARRGEVFIAAWDAAGSEVLAPAALEPATAAQAVLSLGGPARVGGPGAVRFASLFAEAGIEIEDPGSEQGRLSGVAICELGAAADSSATAQPLQPTYIREPDAKLWLERDGRTPAT